MTNVVKKFLHFYVNNIKKTYNPKANLYEYVKPLVDGYFNKRTQEQFENDLENAILQFKG